MTFLTCTAGRNLPARKLIEKILTSRGHQIGETPNPARCADWYLQKSNRSCRLMVVEYTGPETIDMLDVLVDREQIKPANIAVIAPDNATGAQDAGDLGCLLLHHPFKVEELVSWALSSENRCRKQAA